MTTAFVSRWFAARGARFMDQHSPGWANRINRKSLAMSNGMKCILGQEFGTYYHGLSILDIGEFRATWYGFMLGPFCTWSGLRVAWLAEIDKRRVKPVDEQRNYTLAI